jgi:hypothetical protein
MADKATSDLIALTSLENGDLINISEDQGGGLYESKKITALNFDMVKGVRYYGATNSDPVSPSPADGNQYYNTVLNKNMYYDGSRSKWLSVETVTMYFGRNGDVGAGTYYRTINGLAYSATNGFYLPWNVTITGLGYTRDDTDNATFEVTADGVGTAATLLSGAIEGSDVTFNVDVSSGAVLGVRNQAGGNQTTRTHGWVFLKWRA